MNMSPWNYDEITFKIISGCTIVTRTDNLLPQLHITALGYMFDKNILGVEYT